MATILLVEDEDMNADMLTRRLRLRGHEVVRAANGRQAVERAVADRPDVILMDMSLPLMNGWEATSRIKSDPATAAIPVIALTAHALPEFRDRALAAGCDEYASKPFNFEQLLQTIANCIASRRSARPPGDPTGEGP